MLGMPLLIHRAKLLQLFSPHPMDQQVFSCCHNFLTVTQSYNSKNTSMARVHAVKIAKSVFLFIYNGIPNVPLKKTSMLPQSAGTDP